MSIERGDSREIAFVCDVCGTFEDTLTDDFHEALSHVKAAGWQIRLVSNGVWMHYCSRDCLREARP